MRPAPFEYFAPASLAEAAALLAQSEGAGRILAGGQSLLPAMNLRLARPSCLIDLRRVPGLDEIRIEADTVRIGARVTHQQLIDSPELRAAIPLFAMAGPYIAHAAIRSHGTFGGSLALADPASEWPTVLSLLGGRVRAERVGGARWIDVRDFFRSFYTTALAPDEILTDIEIPRPGPGTRFAFDEFVRQSGAFAIVLSAVALLPSAANAGALLGVVGGCGLKPARLVLGPLASGPSLEERIDQALNHPDIEPSDDIHASAQDRRRVAAVLIRRCIARLTQPADRARG
ncbi:MAG: FAD binding domain-containing protein [Alphaproteobacteria bacterium]|nr:FAD binding domain-containing protein [Alphaproteobacteria bacterium]MCW5738987.1 FAD binding domain-containing protein [Alphaproteobacteria bacterium]